MISVFRIAIKLLHIVEPNYYFIIKNLLMKEDYKTLDEFYPFYISQHSNQTCRRLHFIGTLLAFLQLFRTILFAFNLPNLLLAFVIGYGFSWIGHFVF